MQIETVTEKRLKLNWNIDALVVKRNMTTAQFAERANLTYAQALYLRRGEFTRIGIRTIENICSALKCKPGELFDPIYE